MALDPIREQLLELLKGEHAHLSFDKVVEGFPLDRAGTRPTGMAHSAWELVEHMRIAQNDILLFSLSADHVSPKWPDEYWPVSPEPPSEAAWTESIRLFREDQASLGEIIADAGRNLTEPFTWGDGQNLLREILLAADHNAYHLGQLLQVRRAVETDGH